MHDAAAQRFYVRPPSSPESPGNSPSWPHRLRLVRTAIICVGLGAMGGSAAVYLARPRAPKPVPAAIAESPAVTVYTTASGTKYHRAGCAYLSGAGTPVDLSIARIGRAPCSRCKPPR